MDEQDEIREFLTTRRARLTPEQAGLPNFGGRRRVPGLRRDEVALLAGMSVQYYTRFERGNAIGVSDSVLDGISRALHLDDAEHRHLYDLVRAANAGISPQRRRAPVRSQAISPDLQQTLDAMKDVPAVVQNGRLDILATNLLGRALFAPLLDSSYAPANFSRFLFLDGRAVDFYRDWDDSAYQTVALLRGEAGRVPHDRALSALVGELSVQSDQFRRLWASHDVREHRSGVKSIHHPVVGDLDLNYQGMGISADPGVLLLAYTAKPGSVSADGIHLLASWAASPDVKTESDRTLASPDRTDRS